MISEHNDLLITIEVIIINHGLLDKHHFDEVKHYIFMTPELKLLKKELADGYEQNNRPPKAQLIWNKYPYFYGKIMPKAHSNLTVAFKSVKALKARVYTYNKLSEHRGDIASTGKPLSGIIDKVITDMENIKVVIDG